MSDTYCRFQDVSSCGTSRMIWYVGDIAPVFGSDGEKPLPFVCSASSRAKSDMLGTMYKSFKEVAGLNEDKPKCFAREIGHLYRAESQG